MGVEEKFARLKALLREMGRAIIAFSGGVDSTFLLKVARDAMGDGALAVTAASQTYPPEELELACRLAAQMEAPHRVIYTQELSHREYTSNPPERCYHCKKELFAQLAILAEELSVAWILDGANYDDLDDFRPGRQAGQEMGIRSPLLEVGLTKEEIRLLSRQMGLPTWDKPAMACLASRIPYGQAITLEKLGQIEKGERLLRQLGFAQVRVRHHGTIARIEVPPQLLPSLLEPSRREKVLAALKDLGFTYITLDLAGFRSGSMNEVLPSPSPG